ncbi:uncharacterized protein N7459_000196 [Penicillium hispanicum]|uniref:uncharacterized protein n=1 Tax=Penicillium hispanicum TaxID=1080232 RepID=UPI00254039E9|nr:uncharacterized protein N7459_000196 [Penicillium hispanicum]KAJ5593988.1 hypothetical protein N7459_000196 [Penicillium hispanicum]
MSPRTSSDSERVSLSQPRQNSMIQGISNRASRTIQDDELSSQDNSSLCSSIPTAHGSPSDMPDWSSHSLEQAPSSKESPVQMISYSLSQQLMTPTVGPNDVMYTGVDFPAVPDMHDQNDLRRDFYSFVDISSMDDNVCVQTGTPDDALSVAHSSHNEDGQMIAAPEAWNLMMSDGHYPGTTLDQLSSGLFQTVPVSPPLTEASNDISVTSSCSHPGFPSFLAADDTLLGEFTASPIGNHGINPADPLFPSAPLSEKDPNRTIRPTKQSRRAALPASQPQVKVESDFFPPLPVREPARQRSKDGSEARNPREHHYYTLPTHGDGNKYLDSHLKPYRCKVPACMDAQLRFSSNACLFRHEREAHGLHGHGDNPHLCLWEGCERSVPGYGFPRRWNLYDHMRRVHDYASSERQSSPETSPSSTGASKRKDSSGGRKRRSVTGATPAPSMKRTRSVHSQSGSVKASPQTTAQQGQRLQTAERNYHNCRTRLLEELSKITPQDASMHDKVNASLQELYTLSLSYRQLEASQAISQMTNGMPA